MHAVSATNHGHEVLWLFEKVFPFWNDITSSAQNTLLAAASFRQYKKDEIVSGEATISNGLLFVLWGLAKVYLISPAGSEVTLFIIRPNEPCIYPSDYLIGEQKTLPHIKAMEPCAVVMLDGDTWQSMALADPKINQFSLGVLSTHLNCILRTMEDNLFYPLEQRIALFLLEIVKLQYLTNRDPNVLCMTQDELARHIGSSREVVTRALEAFRKNSVLQTSRGKIVILDYERLKTIARK